MYFDLTPTPRWELSFPLRSRRNMGCRQVVIWVKRSRARFFVTSVSPDAPATCFFPCPALPGPGCSGPSGERGLWHWQSYLRLAPSVIPSSLAWAIAQSKRCQWTLSPRKPLNNLFMIREEIARAAVSLGKVVDIDKTFKERSTRPVSEVLRLAPDIHLVEILSTLPLGGFHSRWWV